MLAAALSVAGCGGQPFPTTQGHSAPATNGASTTPQTPKARLLAAAQRTSAEKTARIAMHMSFADAALTYDGSGLIDLTNQKMDLTLKMQSSEADDETIEFRIVNRVAYVDEQGQWTSQPFDGDPATSIVPDPATYVDYLQGISDDVRVDGHEPLRGVDTTRYMATVDLARAVEQTAKTPAQRALVQNALSLFGNLEIPVTAWVDAAGRLRKLNLTMDLSADAQKLGIDASVDPKIDVTTEFYDFGVPVSVVVPTGAISAKVAAADRAVQSDLRNALTAEKTVYTDGQTYNPDPTAMKQIEPSLGWGGKLSVTVAGGGGGQLQVVCMSEKSATGTTFSIADVALGPRAGTYFGKTGCPAPVNEVTVSALGSSW